MKKLKILINVFAVFCLFSSVGVNAMEKLNEADTGKETNVNVNEGNVENNEDSEEDNSDYYFEFSFQSLQPNKNTYQLYDDEDLEKNDDIIETFKKIENNKFKEVKFDDSTEDLKKFYKIFYMQLILQEGNVEREYIGVNDIIDLGIKATEPKKECSKLFFYIKKIEGVDKKRLEKCFMKNANNYYYIYKIIFLYKYISNNKEFLEHFSEYKNSITPEVYDEMEVIFKGNLENEKTEENPNKIENKNMENFNMHIDDKNNEKTEENLNKIENKNMENFNMHIEDKNMEDFDKAVFKNNKIDDSFERKVKNLHKELKLYGYELTVKKEVENLKKDLNEGKKFNLNEEKNYFEFDVFSPQIYKDVDDTYREVIRKTIIGINSEKFKGVEFNNTLEDLKRFYDVIYKKLTGMLGDLSIDLYIDINNKEFKDVKFNNTTEDGEKFFEIMRKKIANMFQISYKDLFSNTNNEELQWNRFSNILKDLKLKDLKKLYYVISQNITKMKAKPYIDVYKTLYKNPVKKIQSLADKLFDAQNLDYIGLNEDGSKFVFVLKDMGGFKKEQIKDKIDDLEKNERYKQGINVYNVRCLKQIILAYKFIYYNFKDYLEKTSKEERPFKVKQIFNLLEKQKKKEKFLVSKDVNNDIKSQIHHLFKDWKYKNTWIPAYYNKSFFKYLIPDIIIKREKTKVKETDIKNCETLNKEKKLFSKVNLSVDEDFEKHRKLIWKKIMNTNCDFFINIKFNDTAEDFKMFYDKICEELNLKEDELFSKLFSSENFDFLYTKHSCTNLAIVLKNILNNKEVKKILKDEDNKQTIDLYLQYFKHIFLLYKILCYAFDTLGIFETIPKCEIDAKIKFLIKILDENQEISLAKNLEKIGIKPQETNEKNILSKTNKDETKKDNRKEDKEVVKNNNQIINKKASEKVSEKVKGDNEGLIGDIKKYETKCQEKKEEYNMELYYAMTQNDNRRGDIRIDYKDGDIEIVTSCLNDNITECHNPESLKKSLSKIEESILKQQMPEIETIIEEEYEDENVKKEEKTLNKLEQEGFKSPQPIKNENIENLREEGENLEREIVRKKIKNLNLDEGVKKEEKLESSKSKVKFEESMEMEDRETKKNIKSKNISLNENITEKKAANEKRLQSDKEYFHKEFGMLKNKTNRKNSEEKESKNEQFKNKKQKK